MSSADVVEFGAHLPLIELGVPASLSTLKSYVRVAVSSGYRYLCANDHLVFSRPWLDGLTTLAALIEVSEDMTLVTTAGLPVVRGPLAMAKTLAALDILSAGRLVVGVGPGSSASDYAAVGVPFEERWRRFDEAVQVLRVMLHERADVFQGQFYGWQGPLLPSPVQRPGPPLWVASWGSAAGLRRVARLGDGWLASAYNTTPDRFRRGLERLADELRLVGKASETFPSAIATTWLHITEDAGKADRMLTDVLAPMLHRPVEELRSAPVLIGPSELCAERVAGFIEAGARRIFVWPLEDESRQLELFRERVISRLAGAP
jgi:alkanesulfonate monooxygenase SsuD/methylene tetrahydromethanopterin reductase-like flavin-dependent oxidoreductase (luciferase family)